MTREKMLTCVWFDKGEARRAAEFYAATFPDSRVGPTHHTPTDDPGARPDELMVEFTVLGRPFLGLNGGAESMCGWCKDRWGFSSQITPRTLIDAVSSPDRAVAKRAFDAMLPMKKIDIATIERAIKGAKSRT